MKAGCRTGTPGSQAISESSFTGEDLSATIKIYVNLCNQSEVSTQDGKDEEHITPGLHTGIA